MEVNVIQETSSNKINYVSKDDVKLILTNCGYSDEDTVIENYVVCNASDKMLGYLSDYWKLKVNVSTSKGKKLLCFFIKAVSRINETKARVVKELKFFEKELIFYAVIKNTMEIPGLKPWSAKLVTALDDALVFQDLNAMQYTHRLKSQMFDMAHTLQALQTLARFHATTIYFEEKRSKELQKPYSINEEYKQYLDEGGYTPKEAWFNQCMNAVLEMIKSYSKYGKMEHIMKIIENRWCNVWYSALRLSEYSSEYRSVICHRDLWNNNILFHYKKTGENNFEPDDCVFVDFQAVRCQPLTGDVMLLLYCNLKPDLREENMETFLNYYYQELKIILRNFSISIDDIITYQRYLDSAEEQRQWGLIVCACLIGQFALDIDIVTEVFSDSKRFDEILHKEKAAFIKNNIDTNEEYKKQVMDIYEEIVERYCIHDIEV